MAHPRYKHECHLTNVCRSPGQLALIDDKVAHRLAHHTPLGVVEAVYLEAVELSTGEQYPVGDLVLIRRDAR